MRKKYIFLIKCNILCLNLFLCTYIELMLQDNSRKVFGKYCLSCLHSLSIYPSAHKQLRRHLPNPFHCRLTFTLSEWGRISPIFLIERRD